MKRRVTATKRNVVMSFNSQKFMLLTFHFKVVAFDKKEGQRKNFFALLFINLLFFQDIQLKR